MNECLIYYVLSFGVTIYRTHQVVLKHFILALEILHITTTFLTELAVQQGHPIADLLDHYVTQILTHCISNTPYPHKKCVYIVSLHIIIAFILPWKNIHVAFCR